MYTKWEQIRKRVFLVSVILTAAMLVGVSYLTSQSAAATLSTQARAVELFPFAFRKHYHNPLWLHLELNSPRRLAHVYEFGLFGLFAALMMLTVPCPAKKTGYSSGTRVSIRLGIAVALCAAVIVVAALAGIAIHIFLMNPIESGCQRFFIINHKETGSTRIGEIFHSFNNGYLNVVKTLFLRDLYIILWSLLLLIPGIIKSYSYRLVPYILAEEPDMDNKEAFRLSCEMMDGNKWHAFCLDLSFIGWHILNVFTFGLLGIFYVKPYEATASAEMYIAIRDHFMGRTDEGASNTTF